MIEINKFYSKRTFLHSLKESHATEEYCIWLKDPVVNEFLNTRDATIEELKDYIKSKNESNNALLLGIFCRKSDKHIGNVKLEPIEDGVATFGILIGDKDYWHKGFGLEVTDRVLEYAFNDLKVKTVRLGVLKGHKRAIRLYETIGFKKTDQTNDSFVMEISRPNSHTVAIVQARMKSKRFPGKSLKKINGSTCINIIVNRLKRSKFLDEVIIATGSNSDDDAIENECKELGVKCFRGHDFMLLDRYYDCAHKNKIDHIVRITADCPLADWRLVDDAISLYFSSESDYVSNVHPALFPDGFDVEVFSFEALKKAWVQAKDEIDREHVTPYIWMRRGLFKCRNLECIEDYSSLRFTVDYPEDLELISNMCNHLDVNECSWKDVIDLYLHSFSGSKVESFTRNSSFYSALQLQKYSNSVNKTWLERAKKVIPSASQTYSKSYKHFANPVVIQKAEGSRVWDVDGSEYIDYICGLGSVILGHNHTGVSDAVKRQIDIGHCYPQVSTCEVDLAETIISVLGWPDKVRFMKNGSDATSAAIRVARSCTGRDYVACTSYHGFHDWYVGCTPSNKGVPESYREFTKVFEYGDIDALKRIIDNYDLAAVILEPISNSGMNITFLRSLSDLCKRKGVLLIFDEVLTGFKSRRLAAHLEVDIIPDLATFGKSMANGYPISALVGSEEYMESIDKDTFISMTFGGEAIAISAAIETVKYLKDEKIFLDISTKSNEWKSQISNFIKNNNMNWAVEIVGFPGHCGVQFYPVRNLSSLELLSVYQKVLAQQGVLTLGINNFCHSHTDKDISNLIDATKVALKCVSDCINKKSINDYIDRPISPVFKR